MNGLFKGKKRKLNQSVKNGLNQCLEMSSTKRSKKFHIIVLIFLILQIVNLAFVK